MRIMLVTMDYPPPMGGIQIVTKNLEEDLEALGHEVIVVNFDGRNTNNYKKLMLADFISNRSTNNGYFHPLNLLNPIKLLKPTGYRDFVFNNLIFRVTNEFRQLFQPDVTHIMKPTLYTAIYECREPFIVSCHGSEVQNTFPVKYSLSKATIVHCVSHYLSMKVQKILDSKGKYIEVIHNSIDPSSFQAVNDCKRGNIIITCCRLDSSKNVDSVIRAIALLSDSILKHYSYIVIGDGPKKNYLEKLTKNLRLNNVEFVGELSDRKKICELLHHSKLFVLCPKPFFQDFELVEEGFGISFIEAQAAGLPVLGSDIGGIPEAVGGGGILVDDPTNPGEIATKIQMILEDSNLYGSLRKNGLERVDQFDRKHWINKFEHMYEFASVES